MLRATRYVLALLALGSACTFLPAQAPADPAPAAPATTSQAPQNYDDAAAPKVTRTRVKSEDNDRPLPASKVHNPVLWKDPGNIGQLDLFYGQGGKDHVPVEPFNFIAESKSGTNPKFDIRDARGKKWRVKLGEEARPEVVASRLLWAVGYFANEDYLLHSATVSHLKMSRGNIKGEQIVDARFARKPGGQDKIATWEWKSNPFNNTREFNGLRVMMAVMNNWDLKDENNAVYADSKTGEQKFLVSDVGATFATNTRELSRSKDKGNLESYNKSKFIISKTDSAVSFGTPAPPTGSLLKSGGILAGDYFKRRGFGWIGKDIPIADVRWVAAMLSQLSHEQIADAFRAANFPAAEADIYVDLVSNRIQMLKEL